VLGRTCDSLSLCYHHCAEAVAAAGFLGVDEVVQADGAYAATEQFDLDGIARYPGVVADAGNAADQVEGAEVGVQVKAVERNAGFGIVEKG